MMRTALCLAALSCLLLLSPHASAAPDGAAQCDNTGGTWTQCGSGCGPATCDNPEPGPMCPAVCVALCVCPSAAPLWDEAVGCIAEAQCSGSEDEPPTEMELCDQSGGVWDLCGSGCGPATCDNPTPGPMCPEVCTPLCACPSDAPLWDVEVGCVATETCEPSDPEPELTPEMALCADTAGTWNECGSGCGPATCDNPNPGPVCPEVCTPLCECPADAPLWDTDAGCVTTDTCAPAEPDPEPEPEPTQTDEMVLCDDTGGTWNTCGSGCGPANCDNPEPGPICPEICTPLCECPADAPLWDMDAGCVTTDTCAPDDSEPDPEPEPEPDPEPQPSDEMVLCADSGGTYTDCGSGCGPATCDTPDPGQDCPEECVPLCECPGGTPYWDEVQGCIAANQCEGEEPEITPGMALCEDTGGQWTDCGSGCGPRTCETPEFGPGVDCPAMCTTLCECPEATPLWSDSLGCISEDKCDDGPIEGDPIGGDPIIDDPTGDQPVVDDNLGGEADAPGDETESTGSGSSGGCQAHHSSSSTTWLIGLMLLLWLAVMRPRGARRETL